jgi:hypothetical protein
MARSLLALPLLLRALLLSSSSCDNALAISAQPCASHLVEQQWTLSPGVSPGDSKLTNVKMATPNGGCWEITGCDTKDGAAVGCGFGCKKLPSSCKSLCDCNGAWNLNSNGTIISVMDVSAKQLQLDPQQKMPLL